jgi:hypothetical protein
MRENNLERELDQAHPLLRRERERCAHLEARLQAIESVQRKAWELATRRGPRRVEVDTRGEH